MRKLATIQVIKDIQPIDGADAIEVATVNGWKAVIQKGIYSVGQKIVYLEIDSWVPHSIAPFLSKGKEPRVYQGVAGERLQTISLRKQISQGLICPLSSIPTYYQDGSDEYYTDLQDGIREVLINDDCIGKDVTWDLGVLKWEREIPAQLAGQARGDFPGFLIKTDEERVQNLSQYFPAMYNTLFVLNEKLNGSSATFYRQDGYFGVCSRNLDLKETEGNAFWEIARRYDLPNKLEEGVCIQGELIGPGIQKNMYDLTQTELYVFNVYHIKSGRYLDNNTAKGYAENLGLKWVPWVTWGKINSSTTVDDILKMAEGKSILNPKVEREGLVWRPDHEEVLNGRRMSFKAISNKFLLNGE
ncbi:RNA ligase (ATP) [bacterium]|nr:RNA ligase (ATP) [bacterium]